jgi:GTP-binding protein
MLGTLEEEAQNLFNQPIAFLKSVVALEGLPDPTLPEVAFAGRSNVGKSSLLNALLRQRIARTSNTPGRTQALNYFQVADDLYCVDMPGYGYAEVPQQMQKDWQVLIKQYLQGRTTLRRLYVLVDARHGLKKNDEVFLDFLDDCAISYQIVLTKADKVSAAERLKWMKAIEAKGADHPALYPHVLETSAVKGLGIEALKQAITVALAPHKYAAL